MSTLSFLFVSWGHQLTKRSISVFSHASLFLFSSITSAAAENKRSLSMLGEDRYFRASEAKSGNRVLLMALAFSLSLERFLQFSNACWMGTSTLRVVVSALAPLAASVAASYSFNTASPRWRLFRWAIRFVALKLEVFFPPLGILAERVLQTAMLLSSSATEKKDHAVEDMFIIIRQRRGQTWVLLVRRDRWRNQRVMACFGAVRPANNFPSFINSSDLFIG